MNSIVQKYTIKNNTYRVQRGSYLSKSVKDIFLRFKEQYRPQDINEHNYLINKLENFIKKNNTDTINENNNYVSVNTLIASLNILEEAQKLKLIAHVLVYLFATDSKNTLNNKLTVGDFFRWIKSKFPSLENNEDNNIEFYKSLENVLKKEFGINSSNTVDNTNAQYRKIQYGQETIVVHNEGSGNYVLIFDDADEGYFTASLNKFYSTLIEGVCRWLKYLHTALSTLSTAMIIPIGVSSSSLAATYDSSIPLSSNLPTPQKPKERTKTPTTNKVLLQLTVAQQNYPNLPTINVTQELIGRNSLAPSTNKASVDEKKDNPLPPTTNDRDSQNSPKTSTEQASKTHISAASSCSPSSPITVLEELPLVSNTPTPLEDEKNQIPQEIQLAESSVEIIFTILFSPTSLETKKQNIEDTINNNSLADNMTTKNTVSRQGTATIPNKLPAEQAVFYFLAGHRICLDEDETYTVGFNIKNDDYYNAIKSLFLIDNKSSSQTNNKRTSINSNDFKNDNFKKILVGYIIDFIKNIFPILNNLDKTSLCNLAKRINKQIDYKLMTDIINALNHNVTHKTAGGGKKKQNIILNNLMVKLPGQDKLTAIGIVVVRTKKELKEIEQEQIIGEYAKKNNLTEIISTQRNITEIYSQLPTQTVEYLTKKMPNKKPEEIPEYCAYYIAEHNGNKVRLFFDVIQEIKLNPDNNLEYKLNVGKQVVVTSMNVLNIMDKQKLHTGDPHAKNMLLIKGNHGEWIIQMIDFGSSGCGESYDPLITNQFIFDQGKLLKKCQQFVTAYIQNDVLTALRRAVIALIISLLTTDEEAYEIFTKGPFRSRLNTLTKQLRYTKHDKRSEIYDNITVLIINLLEAIYEAKSENDQDANTKKLNWENRFTNKCNNNPGLIT